MSDTWCQRALTRLCQPRHDRRAGTCQLRREGEPMHAQPTHRPSHDADINAARECLVARMVEQLRGPGYFLAHVDAGAGQLLADVRWAAQLAGRVVGRRTRTYAGTVGNRQSGMLTVVVVPVETWAASGHPDGHAARVIIETQLHVPGQGRSTDSA